MHDPDDLFDAGELRRLHEHLVARAFVVSEGNPGLFGQTWHYRRDVDARWYLRTWIWEQQREMVLRLGRHDERGEVGPEHRFATVLALETHLDEILAELEGWAPRESELRCPECGGWMRGREGAEGPFFACRRFDGPLAQDEAPCSGVRVDAAAVRVYR